MKKREIAKIAKRARLALTDEELTAYKDINQVLKLVEQIKAVDTDQIQPLAHPIEFPQYLRNDEVTTIDQRDALQATAPHNVENDLYLVPKVLNPDGDTNAS